MKHLFMVIFVVPLSTIPSDHLQNCLTPCSFPSLLQLGVTHFRLNRLASGDELAIYLEKTILSELHDKAVTLILLMTLSRKKNNKLRSVFSKIIT